MEKQEKQLFSNRENSCEHEIKPELVQAIEKGAFTVDDKVNILLTRAGLKPASELLLVIKTWDDKESFENMPEEFVQEDIAIIKELGLPTEIKEREVVEWKESETKNGPAKTYKREQMRILIGRTEEDLDFLKKALESKDDELLGKAFGFSPTAVEAWVGKRKKLNVKRLPKKVRESEAVLFSSPTLSSDNWQKEIEQGQRDADYIKSVSPAIYKELIEMMKKSRK